jgi:hypothetical protein
MKYIFILCAFKILDVDIFLCTVAQTLKGLTLTENYRHPNLGREYV